SLAKARGGVGTRVRTPSVWDPARSKCGSGRGHLETSVYSKEIAARRVSVSLDRLPGWGQPCRNLEMHQPPLERAPLDMDFEEAARIPTMPSVGCGMLP